MKNVVLIGFMGTGKTSIGRLIASRLGRPFIDVDKKIESESGMSISELFGMYGEGYFRQKERATIARIARYNNTVIATGGGAVLYRENIVRLKKNGIIISLTASLPVIVERTGRRKGLRPLLDGPNREQKVAELFAERASLYEMADYCIDTSAHSPQQVAEQIITLLRQGGYLRGRS